MCLCVLICSYARLVVDVCVRAGKQAGDQVSPANERTNGTTERACVCVCVCDCFYHGISYNIRALEPIESSRRTFLHRLSSSTIRPYYTLYVRTYISVYTHPSICIKRQLQRQNHRWPTRVGNILGSSFPRVVNTMDVV